MLETEKQQSSDATAQTPAEVGGLKIGSHTLNSRLLLGTGKYDSFELMRDSIVAAECSSTNRPSIPHRQSGCEAEAY